MHDLESVKNAIQDVTMEDADIALAPPGLGLERRALPVTSIGKGFVFLRGGVVNVVVACGMVSFVCNSRYGGASSAANKLDALLYVLQLEIGVSNAPHEDLTKYAEMVICNCSDQGHLF